MTSSGPVSMSVILTPLPKATFESSVIWRATIIFLHNQPIDSTLLVYSICSGLVAQTGFIKNKYMA